MNEPLVKSSADLVEPLVAEVARLGGLAEAQIADGVDAVTRRDVPLAQAVIARDIKLDTLQADIERRAIDLIATRQPTGRSLRRAVAALKIAMNLERCGDLARNIAKRLSVGGRTHQQRDCRNLQEYSLHNPPSRLVLNSTFKY